MIKIKVAYDKNRVIGAEDKLLWRIPEDMESFREDTTGHNCIMGKDTWFSLPEKFRPLPNRFNIVLTSGSAIQEIPDELVVAKSLGSAIMIPRLSAKWGKKDIFLIGGESVYREGLQFADEIWATEVHIEAEIAGLAKVRHFPEIDPNEWEEVWREDHFNAKIPFSFVHYERRRS